MTPLVVIAHRRMSAARYLNVNATQVHVSEIDLDSDSPPKVGGRLPGNESFWACRIDAIRSLGSTLEQAA
jgi:hypothetical protein